ncbi:Serine phosphatase RsbU, regulator of sigma subunit [Chitinispirillum alkaliphilum]|nr:Serine phosphatase RsbU, regulator of sigma subunit [Chitinispirillum alkaliphilum]
MNNFDLKTDFEIARNIQSAMVPKTLPAVNGLEMESLYFPSQSLRGDLFDIIKFSDNNIAFLMFDISGHGVSSVLLSSMVRVFFSNHLRESVTPSTVLSRVNRDILASVRSNFFVTAFVGYLDLHDYRFTYCSAGHVCPLIYRKQEGKVTSLQTQNAAVGLFDNVIYEDQSMVLNFGDWLLMFTDGIYDIYSQKKTKARKMVEEEFLTFASSKTSSRYIDLLTARCSRMQKSGRSDNDDDVAAVVLSIQSEKKRCNQLKELGFSGNDPVYLQVVRYFEEMEKATSAVLSAMDDAGYSDDCIRKMKVVIMELLANGIIHGNKRDFSKKVVMGHFVDPDKVTVSILDEGDGFDPDEIPDPTLPENIIKDGGRGLYICRNYADNLEFSEKGNRVTFVKMHHLRKQEFKCISE